MDLYRFTVIKIINGQEQYLKSFLADLEEKSTDFQKSIQIIFLSRNLLQEEKYADNVKFIYFEGKNLLVAMNQALNIAKGKYIYFMDADDVEQGFFENIDYICDRYNGTIKYAAMPVRDQHGYCETRIRSRQGTEDNCFLHVDTAYGVGFTDLQAVVFRADCAPRFHENLGIWGARQRFLNELVCSSDRFIWINNMSGVRKITGMIDLLKDFYEDNVQFVTSYFGNFWKKELTKIKKEQEGIPYYIQFSVISELTAFLSLEKQSVWRRNCPSDIFWHNVSPILQELDDAVLIDALGMHDMARIIFFLKKKYNEEPELLHEENDIAIKFREIIVGKASYQSVILHFINIRNGKLFIEGETSIPSCFHPEGYQSGVEINGDNYPVKIESRTNHKNLLGEIYEYADTFKYSHELENTSDLRIRFYTMVGDIKIVYRAIVCMRFMPVSGEIAGAYAVRKDRMLTVERDTLICKKTDARKQEEQETHFQNTLKQSGRKKAKKAASFREYYYYFYKRKKRPIWLFFDRVDKADDNGEALFRYACTEKRDTADIYFIIDKNCKDYQRLKKYGNVVAANTAKHQMLLTLADYVFTSQLNGFVENPFCGAECYYRDIWHQAKVIFLQHGLTKDNHTKWLNRFNQNLTGLITSAHKETVSFLEYPYFYDREQIWETGMPRYDYLYHSEKRQILIMPTWRRSLMEQVWDSGLRVWQWKARDGFSESIYCRTYSSLLSGDRFIELCKKYDYQPVFLPHPLTQPYRKSFQTDSYVKTLSMDTTWRDAFADCDLMITDYSSVAFDFAYLRKPVVYYQFDSEEFFHHHTYEHGYFDYLEDGFGEVVDTEEELLEVLEQYMKDACLLKERYREKIDQFFCYEDKNSCKRILERI